MSVCQEFCSQWGGVVSQHALQVVSQHALQQVSRGVVVSQHALQVSRPTPRGKLMGIWPGGISRPTPKGEVEGDLARGVSRPTPKGEVDGDLARGVSRPTPGESIPACTKTEPPTATAAGGLHPTGMHSCLVVLWEENFDRIRQC